MAEENEGESWLSRNAGAMGPTGRAGEQRGRYHVHRRSQLGRVGRTDL